MEHSLHSMNYFNMLPYEIKIYIFKFLEVPDILNISAAYSDVEHLSYDKEVSAFVNFYKQYDLNRVEIISYIAHKPRNSVITSLSLNCVYWINASDLHRSLPRLTSLKTLYAVDTKLGFTSRDVQLYRCFEHLTGIALTLDLEVLTADIYTKFPNVACLFLHIFYGTARVIHFLKALFKRLEIEELWIIDRSYSINGLHSILNFLPKSLKKFTVFLNYFQSTGHSLPCFAKVFESRKRAAEYSYEAANDDLIDICGLHCELNETWRKFFNELRCEKPFGKGDAYLLSHKIRTLKDIEFRELNLKHPRAVCSVLLRCLIRKILYSKNTMSLKKLSTNFCSFLTVLESSASPPKEYLFKKPRIAQTSSTGETDNLSNHCQKLEELELWGCEELHLKLTSITGIENFQFLKKLTLIDVPPAMHCDFLVEVCKKCTYLNFLSIKPLNYNTIVNKNMSIALQYAHNLQDFRFQHLVIPFANFFETFSQMQNKSLRRIVLRCTTMDHFDVEAFERFLESNPQLLFLFFGIEELSQTAMLSIQRKFNKYRTSKEKIFLIAQNESTFCGRMPMPDLHRNEMVDLESKIGVLDIFNGFVHY